MIASHTEISRLLRHARLCGVGLLLCVLAGCAGKPPPVDRNDLLIPLSLPTRWLPDRADNAASDLAVAAFTNDREGLQKNLSEIQQIGADRKGEDLDALCLDLANATLDDPFAYRESSKRLTSGWGTDPSIEARLDMAVENDPMKLAWRRRIDTWEELWARTFNAVSEPLGQSLITGFVLAPFTIAMSTVHYLASFSNDEALSTTDRQALALHKEFVAHNPDHADTEKVEGRISDAEKKLAKTMRNRRLRTARAALSSGRNRLARLSAERALYWGENREAREIVAKATTLIELQRELEDLSVSAAASPPRDLADPAAYALAIELMTTSAASRAFSDETILRLRDETDPVHVGEANYILAIAEYEAGFEDESFVRLGHLSRLDSGANNMSRHAASVVANPWENAYGAYQTMHAKKRREHISWRLVGDWAKRNRYPNLWKPIGYMIDFPKVLQMLGTSPVRFFLGRWQKSPDFHKPTATLAYRYIGLHPEGEHQREVMGWLLDYEEGRDNFQGALRLADFMEDFDPERRQELSEKAATQSLNVASNVKRPDHRNFILRRAVREYPDTQSGKLAGLQIRGEFEDGSPQKIRVTRSFLIENPRVAGPNGLGLNPILTNEEIEDGELHPTGVTFLGGRTLKINLVDASGDEEDPPKSIFRDVSAERLARAAATLDETARRNQLIDAEDTLEHDADRDQYLERARLGLVSETDKRPTAQSTFVYRSMRERYGMVRGRESILPFDLVFRGDVQGLSLGAFPRWRPPKPTPDAFLYR